MSKWLTARNGFPCPHCGKNIDTVSQFELFRNKYTCDNCGGLSMLNWKINEDEEAEEICFFRLEPREESE